MTVDLDTAEPAARVQTRHRSPITILKQGCAVDSPVRLPEFLPCAA